MITSQIQKDGDEFIVEIPEADMERLGLREGDLVSSTFHKIVPRSLQGEAEAQSESRKEQQNIEPER